MNTLHSLHREFRKRSGQTLALFAIMALAMLLVAGLCVDAGTIYLAKAELDKAVDAASLSIVRNLFQGQTAATTVGQAVFTANYRAEGYVTNAPALNITYATDANSNTTVTILGTATVSPYFMRLVPRFNTFQISSGATATRAKLIMSLVLDVSGSMSSSMSSLKSAAISFINFFDDTMDRVALVSFSSTTNLNVSIRQPFKSTITTAINGLSSGGATYTDGGLVLGLQQTASVQVSTNENVIRVVVLFTDGNANTFKFTWTNSNSQVEVYNVGGYDSSQNSYAIFNSSTGSQITPPHSYNGGVYSGPVPSTGSPYDMPSSTFRSVDGTNKSITGTNFSLEGALRALTTANTIRSSNMYVYCIGLGSNGGIDSTFLAKAANDPTSTTFNGNQPIGSYVLASNTSDLQTAFLDIASKILLRLTR